MKYSIWVLTGILILLSGCEKSMPVEQSWPIIRTLEVTDIDETGVTFAGKLVREGPDPITAFGFVWDTDQQDIRKYNKVILGNSIPTGEFRFRLNHTLVKGLTYHVHVFAITGGDTIFGNDIEFVSQGCPDAQWSLELTGLKVNTASTPIGFADLNFGYILFPNGDFYRFNPDNNSVTKVPGPPAATGLNKKYFPVYDDYTPYLISNFNTNLYQLSSGTWQQYLTLPFNPVYSTYWFNYVRNGRMFFHSPNNSYMYSMNTGAWAPKAVIPSGSYVPVGGAILYETAYAFISNRTLYAYNEELDTWDKKEDYPGPFYNAIVSFSGEEKVFFGLTHFTNTSHFPGWINRKFWAYNPKSDQWSAVQNLPIEPRKTKLFFFQVKGMCYLGTQHDSGYSIWKFDPTKVPD